MKLLMNFNLILLFEVVVIMPLLATNGYQGPNVKPNAMLGTLPSPWMDIVNVHGWILFFCPWMDIVFVSMDGYCLRPMGAMSMDGLCCF